MKTIIAENAGFCYGVQRAIALAEEACKESSSVKSFGPLVHNDDVLQDFKNKGLDVITSLDEVTKDDTIIIRAHGVTPHVKEALMDKAKKVIDGTCPSVLRIHRKVKEYDKEYYQIIMIGDKDHPEVIGILGNAEAHEPLYLTSLEDVIHLHLEENRPYAIIAQTTFHTKLYESIVEAILQKYREVTVFPTICKATEERQQSTRRVSQLADATIVFGSKTSSNSKKLHQIAEESGKPTFFATNSSELNHSLLKEFNLIAITAGASTPHRTIKEAEQMLNEETKSMNTEIEEGGVTEVTATVQVEGPQNGDIVKGKVITVTETEAMVDIGYRQDGILSQRDISADAGVNPMDVLKAGDEIDVFIVKLEDKNGNLILSKRRADSQKVFENAVELMENGNLITVNITEEVKGGLVAEFDGFRAFIPASHVDLAYVPELNVYVGQTFDVKVIEVDRSKNRVVLSRKAALEVDLMAKKEETLKQIEVGSIMEGTVKKITPFGAFIDLGGIDGLVHISELSWKKVQDPSEVLSEGETVKVKIIKLNKENDKITLSMKQTEPDAWTTIDTKYEVGQIVKGTVKRLVAFGAFAEIEPGVEGLIHISQIDTEHVKEAKDVLSVDQEVEAKILSIDKEAHKIALSIKAVKAPTQPRSDRRDQRPRREGTPKTRNLQSNQQVEEVEPLTTSLGDLFGHLFK